eukprot:14303351-Heterocapsa_arctica.AAC.1
MRWPCDGRHFAGVKARKGHRRNAVICIDHDKFAFRVHDTLPDGHSKGWSPGPGELSCLPDCQKTVCATMPLP